MKTINNLAYGIFKEMTDAPEFISGVATKLDLYMKMRYGQRILSPYMEQYTGTEADTKDSANVIFMMYGDRWEHLYETTKYDYDPIANVDATETTTTEYGKNTKYTRAKRHTENKQTQEAFSGETTATEYGINHTKNIDTYHPYDEITTEDHKDEVKETENQIAGFDSATYSPKDKSIETDKAHVTTTINKMPSKIEEHDSNTDARTDTTTYSAPEKVTRNETDESEYTDNDNNSGKDITTFVRHGNIGVTMTQRMIEAERDVWNFKLYDVIIKDVVNEICIPSY